MDNMENKNNDAEKVNADKTSAGAADNTENVVSKKKNKNARILVLLIVVALVVATVFAVLNLKPAGAGNVIDSDWKTPSYLRSKTMTILVCGVDVDEEREEGKEATQTDVIIVANMDLENNTAALLQIPRDTYVGEDLVATGKINALYNWGYKSEKNGTKGVAALAETINNQFQLPIDNYVMISMEGFRKAIDMLGGIEITIDTEMDFGDGIVLQPGTHVLDGAMADLFVRYRGYLRADIERINVQRYFMAAMMTKLMQTPTSQLVSLANAVYPYLETDLSIQQIVSLVLEVKNFKSDAITTVRVPGEPVAAYGIYGLDVFTMHKKELADMLNEYMRPHSEDVPETELNVIEIQNTTDILDETGATLDKYGA
ncbi:MAG: LCP family protein [Oscillospiraceae bacterium]